MGTGEYISVTNQNEMVHSEVALERKMHALFPAAEQEELAGYFRDYGADPDTASRMAAAASLVVTAVALTAGGMTVGRLTGRPLVRSGLRQLLLSAIAIAVTFLVGSLIGGHGA